MKLKGVIDHDRRSISLTMDKLTFIHGRLGIGNFFDLLYPTWRDIKFCQYVTADSQFRNNNNFCAPVTFLTAGSTRMRA